jgi:hypothetical protein
LRPNGYGDCYRWDLTTGGDNVTLCRAASCNQLGSNLSNFSGLAFFSDNDEPSAAEVGTVLINGAKLNGQPIQLGVRVVSGVPEPSSIFGLLALGTLGAASTLKRKLKSSKSSEKETTKVS